MIGYWYLWWLRASSNPVFGESNPKYTMPILPAQFILFWIISKLFRVFVHPVHFLTFSWKYSKCCWCPSRSDHMEAGEAEPRFVPLMYYCYNGVTQLIVHSLKEKSLASFEKSSPESISRILQDTSNLLDEKKNLSAWWQKSFDQLTRCSVSKSRWPCMICRNLHIKTFIFMCLY